MALYRNLEQAIEKLRLAIKSADANTQMMEAIVALAQVKKQLSRAECRKMFTELVPTISATAKTHKEFKFAMRMLQKAFDAEVRGKMKFANELDWFLRSESKLVDELRTLLVGIDLDDVRFLLNVTGDRMLSASNLVRNAHLPKVAKGFDALLQAKDAKARLDKLLKPFVDNGVIARFQQTGLISDKDFWKIKGGITEILSQSLKLSRLEEIRKTFPNAVLIENVMAKTKLARDGTLNSSKSPLQIWDGVIAEINGSQLIIHAKFEIKSGMQGFQQGMDQILDTFYRRFISAGDELHLVHNGKKHVFVNNPNVSGSIKGLDSSNILIAPKGESSMLPNQRVDYGDFDFDYLLLKIDDIEIDHFDIEALVMDFLKAYKA
ncbi:MAG: hypothetical protein E6Q88_07815 [Lysobacteraceae bacterium]|nr:MAG: hypothetical protein E6Q88_07815 [Xanthomonadaceae bacterium]